MCGIAGIVSPAAGLDGSELERTLARLAEALGHRGPDARGTAVAGGIGLAHTRLSILDLSEQGAQPMWSPDRKQLVAYNGEVYNFKTLRSELEAHGESFVGGSDTEVVLRLLAREGVAALGRLDGMFALALVDHERGEVVLARDRAGQKPLYYAALPGGGFTFASELRALLGVPGVDRSVDPASLSHLLSFGFLPSPHSLRSGVVQLRPGEAVRLRCGARPERWRFAPEPGPQAPRLVGSIDELSYELEEILSRAVAEHLVSDVPVGVLLSGGVDSSIVAALAARHTGRIQTFSVVHSDPAYDERHAARAVAEHIGSEHFEVELSAEGLSEDELDTLVDHHGDPFADSSSLAVLRLSREMRRFVTVALSGDGADEVFAGYPRFTELRWLSMLARIPSVALTSASSLTTALGGSRLRRVARALLCAAMPRPRRAVAFTSLFWPEEQRDLLLPEWLPPDPGDALDRLLVARGANLEADPISSAHWLEQRLILPDDMLTKVDRMSMTAALEVRPPLLANDVLDFAARLPFEAKHDGRTGKLALRAVARRLVPPWIVDRPKMGFAIPLENHGGRVLDEATRFALESQASPLRAFFRPEALKDLSVSLSRRGEGTKPEDSPFRRVHRRWLLALLARSLVRMPT